jgi:hypothetical protein
MRTGRRSRALAARVAACVGQHGDVCSQHGHSGQCILVSANDQTGEGGRFPSSADGLIDETDFRAYCREDRLDLARTQRITAELRQCAGIDYQGSIPQNARTGAVVTVESFVGAGARWTYWSQDVLPSLPLGAILYWLADHLAGAERRTLQADPQAARLAAQWLAGDTAVFFHPSVPMTAMNTVSSGSAPARRRTTVPAARNKSWQSIMAVMAGM